MMFTYVYHVMYELAHERSKYPVREGVESGSKGHTDNDEGKVGDGQVYHVVTCGLLFPMSGHDINDQPVADYSKYHENTPYNWHVDGLCSPGRLFPNCRAVLRMHGLGLSLRDIR